jgi:hypothetical protein
MACKRRIPFAPITTKLLVPPFTGFSLSYKGDILPLILAENSCRFTGSSSGSLRLVLREMSSKFNAGYLK